MRKDLPKTLGMLVRSGRNKMRLWLLNTCLGNPVARKPYQNTWLRNTIDNYTILSLDHWTFGPKSKILRFYQVTLQKWLVHWTFGPKSKTHRLYQVTLHKRLDHWTFGPKSKIHRFYQETLHKWLDHWTFGPK